jgi:hypothetical protein
LASYVRVFYLIIQNARVIKNLKQADYAKRIIHQLFSEELLQKSVKKIFKYCISIVYLNKGNGQFKIEKLPQRVQFSSLNAIQCYDINGDGYKGMIVQGNEFGFPLQFGRLDGNFGNILLNKRESGFYNLQQKQT